MAKATKIYKLLKASAAPQKQKPIKGFGTFANRLAASRKKKMQNMSDTQKRLVESKKNNKMIKVSKKAKRFALLDQQQQGGQVQGLTHRGKNIKDLKQFDDVNFNESDLENDQDFDNIQQRINFAGFQATNNLLETDKPQNDDPLHPKSKNQIYKEIIQKSKAYKLFRQQQYEENLNKAIQLDENFQQFVGNLKFRNKDKKIQDKIENRDVEYDKLMNELKDDERIVSNKIIEKSEKLTERIRNKKNDQLKKLMENSDGQEEDVRGWVQEESNQQEDSNDRQSGSEGEQGGQSEQGDHEDQGEDEQQISENDQELQVEDLGAEGQEEEESYDQLDDVDLSSPEQEQVEGQKLSSLQELDSQEIVEQFAGPPFDDQLQSDQEESSSLEEEDNHRRKKNKKNKIKKNHNKNKQTKPVKNVVAKKPNKNKPKKLNTIY